MIPFSGIIHPEKGTLNCGVGFLPDSQSHGDPGAAFFRIFQKNGAAVDGSGAADKHHAKTDAVAAVFNFGVSQVTGENAAAKIFGNTAAAVLDR